MISELDLCFAMNTIYQQESEAKKNKKTKQNLSPRNHFPYGIKPDLPRFHGIELPVCHPKSYENIREWQSSRISKQ